MSPWYLGQNLTNFFVLQYIPAIVVCSVMYGLQFIILSIWRLYCKTSSGFHTLGSSPTNLMIDIRQNQKRDRLVRELGMSVTEAEHQGRLNAESDMTDVENVHFRYNM